MAVTSNQSIRLFIVPGISPIPGSLSWLENWAAGIDRIAAAHGVSLDKKIHHDYLESFTDERCENLPYLEDLAELTVRMPAPSRARLFRAASGLDPLAEDLKRHAATIIKWVRDKRLRDRLTADLTKELIRFRPSVIVAHGLGSLIAFHTIAQMSKPFLRSRTLITLGSPLANPYVLNLRAGRLITPPVHAWYHLYNEHDEAFTCPVLPEEDNHIQINVTFETPDPLNHQALAEMDVTAKQSPGYLDHYGTHRLVWPRVFGKVRSDTVVPKPFQAFTLKRTKQAKDHRALLIGVDEYRNDAIPTLSGCVNDTYLMSQVLQSSGMSPDSIRLLHNHRATRSRILDRLDWLLEEIEDGELRLLHFSGHGARLESYGIGETVDRVDECLCPTDFNWTAESAILDDVLCEIYSQLPYGMHFVLVLDCCHSGGMARSGPTVRGLTAPRDVAHRGLFYQREDEKKDPSEGMWLPRAETDSDELPDAMGSVTRNANVHPMAVNPRFFRANVDPDLRSKWIGTHGTLRKIGRAPSLRQRTAEEFDQLKAAYDHEGPYLPIIFEACGEEEQAQEHVHGSTSYGAFTFNLARGIQIALEQGDVISYRELIEQAEAGLKRLRYPQKPQLLCPKSKPSVRVRPANPAE